MASQIDRFAELRGASGARARALRAAAGAIGVVVACYVIFVLIPPVRRFDDATKLFAGRHELNGRLAARGLPSLLWVADVLAVGSITALAAALLVWRRTSWRRAVTLALLMVAVPVIAAESAKRLLPRPVAPSLSYWVRLATYPSGHVAFTAACAFALLWVAPVPRRAAVALMATVQVTAMMFLVVASGGHRVSDALGGAVLALGWVLLLAAGYGHEHAMLRSAREVRTWTWAAIACSTAGLALAATAVPHDVLALTRPVANRAFLAALLLMGGAGFALIAAAATWLWPLAYGDAPRRAAPADPTPTTRPRHVL